MSKLTRRCDIAGFGFCVLLGLAACSGPGASKEESATDIDTAGARSQSTSSALASSTAGSGSSGAATAGDPLLGTWLFGGSVPNLVTIALTFSADHTLRLVEQVAPATLPVGTSSLRGCATTDAFSANTVASSVGGSNSLTWTFVDGTANAVTGCGKEPDRGTAMTEDGLTAYIEQGMLPPRSLTYSVTADTLTINPGVHDLGGLSGETAFIKVVE